MVSYKENGVIKTRKHVSTKKFFSGIVEPIRWAKPIRPRNQK